MGEEDDFSTDIYQYAAWLQRVDRSSGLMDLQRVGGD
jgi:hypothetical protein